MLNIYKLTQTINESAAGGYIVDNVPAYEFVGGLDEATSEMNYVLMAEAADLCAFRAGADEIMCEAAISNPDTLEALSENVFQTVGAKVKSFIDKVIAMVKGMIEKIKAFFFKLTGKIDKWLTIMKPRITAASGYSGAGDQTIEIHDWAIDYIATEGGMVSALGTMADKLTKSANDKFDKVSMVQAQVRTIKSTNMADTNRGKTGDDERIKKDVEAMNSRIEDLKTHDTEKGDKYRGEIATALGVDAASMDEVWNAVTKKATGGEKVTKKYSEAAQGKGVDGMLKAIEGSKKSISALKKAYEKHLTDLNKVKSAVEKAYKSESKMDDMDKFPSELKGKYQSLITELTNDATREISIMEAALNTAKSKHIGFIQQMTSEYMTALSKYANYKGKKKDEV